MTVAEIKAKFIELGMPAYCVDIIDGEVAIRYEDLEAFGSDNVQAFFKTLNVAHTDKSAFILVSK